MNAYSLPGFEKPTIKKIAASNFNIPDSEIDRPKGRKRELVEYRQFVMYVHQVYLKESQRIAGSVFGKDHATAFHAKRTVTNLIETDKIFRSKALKAIEQLKSFKLI